MKQVTDLSAIEKLVEDVLHANPEKVAQARTKPALIGWFVGQVMKSSGQANPQTVNELLQGKADDRHRRQTTETDDAERVTSLLLCVPLSSVVRSLFFVLCRLSSVLCFANHFDRFARFELDSVGPVNLSRCQPTFCTSR